MNYQSIEWHKECLKNQVATAQEQVERIKQLRKENDRLVSNIFEYDEQIKRAEKEGKESFDRDSYNKQKKKVEV